MPANRARVTLVGAGAAAAIALSAPLIERYEGTITATYLDPAKILTSCTGHTGPELRMGQTFTPIQCRLMLASDQRRILRGMMRCTLATATAPVEVWAATLSFSFNVGYGTFCKYFAPMINRGDLNGACRRMGRYVYARGVKYQGLVNRRRAEVALCLQGLDQ